MKCLVLAGGSGDRLWPLSRKNYPKQFMNLHKSRSLFQETIARNLPYSQEFCIIINENYQYLAEGQMQAFQGVSYRCIYEQNSRKTAPAVALACIMEDPKELLLVVAADNRIEGNYGDAILNAKKFAQEGELVSIGVKIDAPRPGYGVFRCGDEYVTEYFENPTAVQAEVCAGDENCLWDAGILMMRAGDYLEALKIYAPEVYLQCVACAVHLDKNQESRVIPAEWMARIPAVSVGKAVSENAGIMRIVEGDFVWRKALDLESMKELSPGEEQGDVILHECARATVMNYDRDQLVVANGLDDFLLVNTPDAVYASKKGRTSEIKKIMRLHYEEEKKFFEIGREDYRSWGRKEVLHWSEGCKVKRITVYPGKSIPMHRHVGRSEHWSIVTGSCRVILNGMGRDYFADETVHMTGGTLHEIRNTGRKDLIFIETSIGEIDGIRREKEITGPEEPFIRMEPVFQDYLWGGTRLRDVYGKLCEDDRVAESWELSTHPAGQSLVASGTCRGMRFERYLDEIGRDKLGWKCQPFPGFPILVKFIDARDALSIQVHPDDDYAMPVEHEYGKSEMWYIMDCEPGAFVYYGFNRKVTKEEIRRRVAENTLVDILQKHPVKRGETVFVSAGTVHAIGAGILICEIQQSSNATYRLYDYGRRDAHGNLRELHLDKALDVLLPEPASPKRAAESICTEEVGYSVRKLGECKYFTCSLYEIDAEASVLMDESSFRALVAVSGSGELEAEGTILKFKAGDTFFLPAGQRSVTVRGTSRVLSVQI